MQEISRNAARRTTRFRKGQSGNPDGRAPGSRNKVTLAVEVLLAGEAERLTRKAIELALAGDTTAMRLCLERIAPPRRGRTVEIDFGGPVLTPADLTRAASAVLAAVGAGEISTDEAADLTALLERVGAALERRDLEARVAALEAKS